MSKDTILYKQEPFYLKTSMQRKDCTDYIKPLIKEKIIIIIKKIKVKEFKQADSPRHPPLKR